MADINKEIYFCVDPFAYEKAKRDAGSWQDVESTFYSLTEQLIKDGCSPIITTSMAHFSYSLIEKGYDVFLCCKDKRVKIERGMKLLWERTLDGNPDEIYYHHGLLYLFKTGEFSEYFEIAKED